MDMRMTDDEDKRADRKMQPKVTEGYDYNRQPNRTQRRNVAKKRGVFKHPDLWPKINGGYKNQQTQRGDE